MRMIVEAFKETLELGLQEPDQVVVCTYAPTFVFWIPCESCFSITATCGRVISWTSALTQRIMV